MIELFGIHATDFLLACILFTLWWMIWHKR
jgi:hypothetical protein